MKATTQYLRSLLIASMLMSGVSLLHAQGRSIPKGTAAKGQEALLQLNEELPEGQTYRYKLLSGLNVSVDILDPALYLTAFDHASFEGQLMLNLHNRFFPMASFGMGLCDETSDNGLDYGTGQKQECRFKSDLAPFGKIGMAYNLNYNDIRPYDAYLIFLRYGMAYSKGEISNLYYASENYLNADNSSLAFGPMNITDHQYYTHWIEAGGMLKVQISGRFSLGWDLYWKIKLYQSGTTQGTPYFVPGFGTVNSSVGFSFRLFYDIF